MLSKCRKCFKEEGIINSDKCWEEHEGDQTLNIELAMGRPLVTLIKAHLVDWWSWMPARKATRKQEKRN